MNSRHYWSTYFCSPWTRPFTSLSGPETFPDLVRETPFQIGPEREISVFTPDPSSVVPPLVCSGHDFVQFTTLRVRPQAQDPGTPVPRLPVSETPVPSRFGPLEVHPSLSSGSGVRTSTGSPGRRRPTLRATPATVFRSTTGRSTRVRPRGTSGATVSRGREAKTVVNGRPPCASLVGSSPVPDPTV